jgi:bifunctional non-homologous end joining protein LigD
MSRNENDLADRFPILVQALGELPDETNIDGELVALDETGRPSFNVLQNYSRGGAPLQFYAFDVLTLAGRSLQESAIGGKAESAPNHNHAPHARLGSLLRNFRGHGFGGNRGGQSSRPRRSDCEA